MKLLIGNGKRIEVYEMGDKPIYIIQGDYIPLHGTRILPDKDAKLVLKEMNKYGKGTSHNNTSPAK